MHFPIVEILSDGEKKGQFSHIFDEGDTTINYFTDYAGEKYRKAERDYLIHGDNFADFFEGIANVDPEKETITFLSKETIVGTLHDYYVNLVNNLAAPATSVSELFSELRFAGEYYKNDSMMFIFAGYGKSSMQFIEDAPYLAGQTFKIGEIYDAHL